MKTIVTEVVILPIRPKDGLVAIASCVLDEKLFIGSIGIYTKLQGGYRLTYPTKGPKQANIFHPISKEAGESIEQAILTKYEELYNKE